MASRQLPKLTARVRFPSPARVNHSSFIRFTGNFHHVEVPLTSRIIFKVRKSLNKGKINYPYLSGDAFKALCDLVIDQDSLDIPGLDQKISAANIIFCRSNVVDELFHRFGKVIRARVLIAGNSDRDFTEELNIPPSFEHVLLQNSFISDGKRIHTLPIGLENQKLGINGLPKNFRPINLLSTRKREVLVGPFSPTHSARIGLLEKYEKEIGPWQTLNSWIFPDRLVRRYEEFTFVLSPRGNGVDTHRVWESLYKGAHPILEDNSWSRSLKDMGYPVSLLPNLEPATVREFVESSAGNSKDLQSKDLHVDPQRIEKLWMPYWESLIKAARPLA